MAPASSSGSPKRASGSTARRSRGHQPDKRLSVIRQPVGVVGVDHAVELPQRDDHPQGRPGAGGGLRLGGEARRARRRCRRWRWRFWPSAPGCPRACSTSCTSSSSSDIGKEFCENPTVRKLTFTGSTFVGRILLQAGRRPGQEMLDGAGRQRALHRLRRRRSRRRGARARIACEVPQQRPDLRLRQPDLRAGRRLRCLRRETRQGRGSDAGGRRAR